MKSAIYQETVSHFSIPWEHRPKAVKQLLCRVDTMIVVLIPTTKHKQTFVLYSVPGVIYDKNKYIACDSISFIHEEEKLLVKTRNSLITSGNM